jgi:hypothetical protein
MLSNGGINQWSARVYWNNFRIARHPGATRLRTWPESLILVISLSYADAIQF